MERILGIEEGRKSLISRNYLCSFLILSHKQIYAPIN